MDFLLFRLRNNFYRVHDLLFERIASKQKSPVSYFNYGSSPLTIPTDQYLPMETLARFHINWRESDKISDPITEGSEARTWSEPCYIIDYDPEGDKNFVGTIHDEPYTLNVLPGTRYIVSMTMLCHGTIKREDPEWFKLRMWLASARNIQ